MLSRPNATLIEALATVAPGRPLREGLDRILQANMGALIVVGDILDQIEGIEFLSFGAEDVVSHKLVQRIVEAYDVHAQREAPELRSAERSA